MTRTDIKLLIADDEERWRRLLGDFLKNEGYQIVEAADGDEAVAILREQQDISLVILDIMMPKMDGLDACIAIRGFSNIPIMIVTARDDEITEISGFDCGADEYISKPIKFPVFLARVKSLLKRHASVHERIEVSGIVIDTDAHTVMIDDEEINLTPREYELLLYTAQNKNIALSRQQILSAVWNFDYYGDARTVDTHIKNLRMKLGPKGAALKTVRGRGYKLEG